LEFVENVICSILSQEGKAALKVRCATPAEAEDWKEALEEEAKSQEDDNVEEMDSSPEVSYKTKRAKHCECEGRKKGREAGMNE
jgi:hypothetical protein